MPHRREILILKLKKKIVVKTIVSNYGFIFVTKVIVNNLASNLNLKKNKKISIFPT